ncbi:hypothetical protein Q4E40_02780 [Pontibacter sp. BT731]|uniref:hypothetical protein n=1 Tax=Pontibacter coccineus TaxID=3063328 RepID=UPI0026E13949|nr:hypothetical protein [Pontibacter sp. BT731]MDO6389038.1 hypothetical protein [Pontibacter sp. BT731]
MRETALAPNGAIVPGSIVQFVTSVTLPVAIENGEQLSKINRENQAHALRLVAELVKNLANFFKTKRALENEDDYFEVAALIIEGHKLLKVEEIAYAFKLAKLGKLKTKVLDRLDGSTILAIVDEYDRSEERAAYFEKRNTQHKAPTVDKFETLSFLTDNADKIGIDISKIGKEKEDREAEYRRIRQEWLQSNPEKRRE